MKIHAKLFDNEYTALCGIKLTIYNGFPAYAFKKAYKKEIHCLRCYQRILKWGNGKPIKRQTEADKVRQEGRR